MTVDFKGRPPAEAVDYLRRKVVGGRFSFNWRDVWREEHLVAFVVAKAMTRDLLLDIHGGLLKALDEGWSRDRFIAELTPQLQAKGWWGKQRMTDPLTGKAVLAQLGSPRRLQTIFDVNMRMAHSAGRWERLMRSASDRPFLVYKHTPQANPREQHQAWDGITLPVTHPFWATHWTPNGWNCKCYTLSLRRAERVTPEDELRARGVYRTQGYRNRRTGETMQVPFGIDPGFDYNVGQARMANFVPPPATERQREQVIGGRTPAALPPPPRPRKPPFDAALRPDLDGSDGQAVFDAFSKVLGKGEGDVFIDRAQVPLVIGRGLFQRKDAAGAFVGDKANLAQRGPYAEILAATLRDPAEIWHSVQATKDGGSVFVRSYVAAWDLGAGERQWFFLTFTDRGGWWFGSTAFAPGEADNPARQLSRTDIGARVGALVYRRK
jgi:hypothetical protein